MIPSIFNMQVFSKKFDCAGLVAETGVFNESDLATIAAKIADRDAPFETKDFKYTLKGEVLEVVLYSSVRPARSS